MQPTAVPPMKQNNTCPLAKTSPNKAAPIMNHLVLVTQSLQCFKRPVSIRLI
jgi:hypothetical protein